MIYGEVEFKLSPELNSLIGGRGSGKSTLLEYIAFGLGRSCFDFAKHEYSGNERLAELIQDTIISAGAYVEVVVVQDNARFHIFRHNGNSYQPTIRYPDGSEQTISAQDLRGLFPAVVYSQGELSELGRNAGKDTELTDLLQFVSPEYKKDHSKLETTIEEAGDRVAEAVQELTEAWGEEARLRQLKSTSDAIKQRIVALEKTLPELPKEKQEAVAKFDHMSAVDTARQQVNKHLSDLSLLATTLQSNTKPRAIPDFLEAKNLKDTYNLALTEFNDGLTDIVSSHRIAALAQAMPRPSIRLYYMDGEKKLTFEKASEGQRSAALLFMLLEQTGGPLLVDQPEGDLDNKIITQLTESLHAAKKRRQIIFASHNANIVVNGSSEMVGNLDVTEQGRGVHHFDEPL